MQRMFIGRKGKYQIPHGARVRLLRCFPKRKCLIEYEGTQFISMVNLLRKIPE